MSETKRPHISRFRDALGIINPVRFAEDSPLESAVTSLQALGQCNEALTAKHEMSMLPARERQAEVLECGFRLKSPANPQ